MTEMSPNAKAENSKETNSDANKREKIGNMGFRRVDRLQDLKAQCCWYNMKHPLRNTMDFFFFKDSQIT